MASPAVKSKRARKLLRRLITRKQWDEFVSYDSFREEITYRGRTWLIELGMQINGWIQFTDLDGKEPSFIRTAGMVTRSHDWCMEDLLISLLLRVRMQTRMVDPCWACRGSITPDTRELIVRRRFHKALSMQYT